MMVLTRYFPPFLIFLALWLTTATHSHFSQDSWSYFELSRHIFDDFYHINTWRQFHMLSERGASFPPLWPLLIAGLNAVLGVGIYAGFILNFAIVACTFLLLWRMAKIWFGEREWGCLLFAALMMTPDYTTAIFSAGTLPLSLLLLLMLLYLYATKRHSPVLFAVIAGLGVLNRFDFMLPALALGLFLHPPRKMLLYYALLAVTLSPWIAYSLSHFNVFWVSDNSRTLLSAIPIFVRDYYPDGVPLLWNHPLEWAQKTISAILKSADVMFTATSALPWLLGAALLAVKRQPIPKNILLFAALIFAQLLTVLLTGFVETRYYVPLQFFLLVALLWLALPAKTPASMRRAMPVAFACFAVVYAGAYVAKSVVQSASLSMKFNPENQRPIEFDKIIKCSGTKASILLPPLNYSYKFGALTGIRSYIEPTNMNPGNARQFIAQFQPTHILTAQPTRYGLRSKPVCSVKGWGESEATYFLYKL